MRKNKPFFMVFLSRFLFQLGINTLIQIFPYWIQDCVPLPSGSSVSFSTNLTLVPLLIISPIAAGILSLNVFRRRRKAVVYYCAVSFAVVCALTWAPVGYSTAFVLTAIMGLGYGPFSAIEFAMALDTLHEVSENYARDLSMWHNALVLPSLFSTPLAGVLRDVFQPIGPKVGVTCFGYKVG
ncbi:hypothetical protein M427DRAFT_93085 [Gonapodya prolifera JEL478]|uniref:MFS general substrate transporter n=1 Tax=Gonapodya prolifera (strain JEL478) TaxID=1344416 RepID=A0A139B017_GONPJ|nr:hypothetical protein M427DRAFT_93085 [Gonapodya prolifera JEL478]|eukprot:KXS22336.1 hypothetical protein M427DRAFT_93085 [Gonapodya prolifera JEL478]